jgi:ADP-ribose pyrophosphatase YjhB (NUDIX family)
VSVVLLPVDDGLLVVRRAIAPGRGKLALPGGFIELEESWQEAGARELFEETGIRIDPQLLSPFAVHSAPDGTILIFGLAPPWIGPLPPFTSDDESSARLVIRQAQPMAFSLHTRVVRDYFGQRSAG